MSVVRQGAVAELQYQIPTDDGDVRYLLRSLLEPITLFGEDKLDRRERLIQLVSQNLELYQLLTEGNHEDGEHGEEEEDEEEYYEPVSDDPVKCDELYELRINLTKVSLVESAKLNARQYEDYQNFDMTNELIQRRALYKELQKIELKSSQTLSERTISKVKYLNNKIIVSSWDGDLKIIENNDEELPAISFKEHLRISKFDANQDTIITGDFNGDCNVYNYEKHKSTFKLHELRISDLKIHPFMSNIVISSSFDKTFKLYDLHKNEDVYQQFQTHSKEIFCIGLNFNGSLLSTCGLDSLIRIWDLRSGKVLTNLQGHQSGVYCNAWHPNGYQLITGSDDCTLKVWDLRNPGKEVVSIPQHSKLISDVKISECGKWLASSSYDKKINISSFDNFNRIRTLEGHDDKIMSLDILGNQIISGGWDRSLKMWDII